MRDVRNPWTIALTSFLRRRLRRQSGFEEGRGRVAICMGKWETIGLPPGRCIDYVFTEMSRSTHRHGLACQRDYHRSPAHWPEIWRRTNQTCHSAPVLLLFLFPSAAAVAGTPCHLHTSRCLADTRPCGRIDAPYQNYLLDLRATGVPRRVEKRYRVHWTFVRRPTNSYRASSSPSRSAVDGPTGWERQVNPESLCRFTIPE